MSAPQRILILQLGGMSELILATPVIASLKHEWPDSRIVLVARDAAAQLAACIPGIDETIDWATSKISCLKRCLTGGFDISIDFSGSNESLLMTTIARAPVRGAFHDVAGKSILSRFVYNATCEASFKKLPAIDCNLAILEACGCDSRIKRFDLTPPSAPFKLPDSLDNSFFAVVHPGTTHPERMWSLQGWADVIDHLSRKGLEIVLTGGEDALVSAHTQKILNTCASKGHLNLTGKLTPPDLVSVISRCSLAIGVDTAAMQIAAAFEKPQLVLFGPTSPFSKGPRHKHALVLLAGNPEPLKSFQPEDTGGEMGAIETPSVIQAVDRLA